jgi:hypothetical protein
VDEDKQGEEIALLLEGIRSGRFKVLSFESEWLSRKGKTSNIKEVNMQLIDSASPGKSRKTQPVAEEKKATKEKKSTKKPAKKSVANKKVDKIVKKQPAPVAPLPPDMADMSDVQAR